MNGDDRDDGPVYRVYLYDRKTDALAVWEVSVLMVVYHPQEEGCETVLAEIIHHRVEYGKHRDH